MANVNHSTLTDPYLHEPKGVAAASAGDVYIADGAGSGDWTQIHNYINGYIDFDATTPAYQHSVTTSFTALNPTFSVGGTPKGWTGETSPNARLVYEGTEDTFAKVSFTLNFQNASGTDKDVEFVFYKNGSVMNGGHIIVTSENNHWRSATLTDYGEFSTDDYLEVFVKADASFTLDIASASLTILGVPM